MIVILLAAALCHAALATVTLTASPSVVTTNPGVITLTWAGLPENPVNYSIGLYLDYPSIEHVGGGYLICILERSPSLYDHPARHVHPK